jgi:ferredoxin--NADP+ reductase
MSQVGVIDNPLRVAVIGSGPAAFYVVEFLFKQTSVAVQVDMFDRLPTPYGLVRFGVAPDHQKIKSVTKVYETLASKPNFRFFGNVELGKHITLDEMKLYYHQILFATGAQSDRRMGIPGEDLQGSHPATEFVAWYNGHPDFANHHFDLSQERAAVVGVGNVAIDVARILSLSPQELRKTDMADYAIEALSQSKIKEVYLLGRRGPAQAAFTNPEIKELGEMQDADVVVRPDEVQLDPLSQSELDASKDQTILKKVELLQGYALRQPQGRARKFAVRFLVSPVELVGDASGKIVKMKLVRNTLVKSDTGALSAKATEQFEELPVGLVFRSVGYRGTALPGVPFNDRAGTILNEKGRVLDPNTKQPLPGLYTSGWIKRGPSGIIGTNKPDSVETAMNMLDDLSRGAVLHPSCPDAASIEKFVRERQPQFFTFDDWLKLDKLELANGAQQGRPRVKFTSVKDMLTALGRSV